MERISGFSRIPSTGAPAFSCIVTVYDVGTLNLATIYADDLASPTPKANPFSAAATTGFWFFYAAAGRYDVAFSGGGIPAGQEYTIADVPAGLGDGPVVAYAFASLPGTSAPHAGRLARVTDQQRGLWIDDGTGWVPALDYALRSFTKATLPAAGVAGRLRRVTDDRQGLFLDDGAAWQTVLAYALEAHAVAGLPAAGLAGRLRRVTDEARGLWLDTGSQWRQLEGSVANVLDFGAVGDGVTDDYTAVQAAVNANYQGTVVFPSGMTFAVSAPLQVPNGIVLRGLGAGILGVGKRPAIVPHSTFSGDAIVRAARRDDNVLANSDSFGIENLRLGNLTTVPSNGFSVLDLTGAGQCLILNVDLLSAASAAQDDAMIRIADRNYAGTSTKRCRNNTLVHVTGGASRFLTVVQSLDDRIGNNVFVGFHGVNLVVGLSLVGLTAGAARLAMVGGELVGTGAAGTKDIDLTGVTTPAKLTLLQVEATGFVSVTSGIAGETFLTTVPGFDNAGTSIANPLSAGGTLSQNFNGAAYLKIPGGTALVPGANTFTFTFPGLTSAMPFFVAPLAGFPSAPVSFYGVNAGATFTLTIVSSSSMMLSSNLVLRVLAFGGI